MKNKALALSALMILVSCGKDTVTETEYLNQIKSSGEMSQQEALELDQKAINSLLGQISHLNRGYVESHYQFRTAQGQRKLLKSIKDGKIASAAAEKLIWNLLANNIAKTEELTSQNEDLIENILNSIEGKTEIELTFKLISYIQNGPEIFDEENGATSFYILKDKDKTLKNKAEELNPLFGRVDGSYASTAYSALITNDESTKRNEIRFGYSRDMREKDEFIYRTLEKINNDYYKKILSDNTIFETSNGFVYEGGNVSDVDWKLSFRGDRGRCSPDIANITFSDINSSWGGTCRYSGGDSTTTHSELSILTSTQNDNFNNQTIQAYAYSYIRGGFKDRGDENQTAAINFKLSGEAIIPKCNSVFDCDPIVTIRRYFQKHLSGGYEGISQNAPRKSSTELYVNGERVKEGQTIFVSRATEDIKLKIVIKRSDRHVGACCQPTAGQQKLQVNIDSVNRKENQQMRTRAFGVFE
jgi:hypothetical protein